MCPPKIRMLNTPLKSICKKQNCKDFCNNDNDSNPDFVESSNIFCVNIMVSICLFFLKISNEKINLLQKNQAPGKMLQNGC